MKRVMEILLESKPETPSNMRFINQEARLYWAMKHGQHKPLVLVSGLDWGNQIMTQEAYSLAKDKLMGPISFTYISPEEATIYGNWVWTTDDIETFLAAKAQP